MKRPTIGDLLTHAGHHITDIAGDNLRLRCLDSLHVPRKGRPSTRDDTLSVHARSGLWHCFTCGASGHLDDLVRLLGYRPDVLWTLDYDTPTASPRERVLTPLPECDQEWFASLPVPPAWAREQRGIDSSVCNDLGLRWVDGAVVIPVGDPPTLYGWELKPLDGRHPTCRPGTPKGQFLFGHGATGCPTAVVVESAIDVARIYSATTLPVEAVATLGPVTDRHLSLLNGYQSVILAFDNDTQGDAYTDRARRALTVPTVTLDYTGTRAEDIDGGDPGDLAHAELHRVIGEALDDLALSELVPTLVAST